MRHPTPESAKSAFLRRVRRVLDEAPRELSRVSERLSRASEELAQFVRKQPLAAGFAALTGGFLAARVLARR